VPLAGSTSNYLYTILRIRSLTCGARKMILERNSQRHRFKKGWPIEELAEYGLLLLSAAPQPLYTSLEAKPGELTRQRSRRPRSSLVPLLPRAWRPHSSSASPKRSETRFATSARRHPIPDDGLEFDTDLPLPRTTARRYNKNSTQRKRVQGRSQ